MSQTCQTRKVAFSFDHLLGPREEEGRDSETEGPRDTHIDYQLKFARLQRGQISGLLAIQNLPCQQTSTAFIRSPRRRGRGLLETARCPTLWRFGG